MTKQEQYLYNEIVDLTKEVIRLKDLVFKIRHEKYIERLCEAGLDPTGQDLDDFIKKMHEPDNYDHIECPIQRAEARMGA